MFGLNLDRIISKDYGQLVKSEETIEPEDTTIEPEDTTIEPEDTTIEPE